MEHPEVHQPHVRHGGGLPRWLELVIAITALITSISSIAIAVHHSEIMNRLVQANSIPYMQGGFTDVTPEGERVLSLDLLNQGVGPAHEQSLRVTVDGRYVRSVSELLDAAFGPAQAAEAKSVLGLTARNQVKTRSSPAVDGSRSFASSARRRTRATGTSSRRRRRTGTSTTAIAPSSRTAGG